jgi:hypothetical protein
MGQARKWRKFNAVRRRIRPRQGEKGRKINDIWAACDGAKIRPAAAIVGGFRRGEKKTERRRLVSEVSEVSEKPLPPTSTPYIPSIPCLIREQGNGGGGFMERRAISLTSLTTLTGAMGRPVLHHLA